MFVKICGTTNEEDALLSVAMGADALGFIFAPSPRQIQAGLVEDIVKRIPPEILTVGVFRNEPVDRVIEVVLKSGVRAVQLHGRETADDVRLIKSRLPLAVIKAFSAGSAEVRSADRYGADAVLLDAPSPGSGQVFDWRLAEGVPDRVRLMLAGGLDPDNVADAIEAVHPWGVDVASGVEATPGRKDPRKLREFIKRAKAAAPTIRQHRSDWQTAGSALYNWQDDS